MFLSVAIKVESNYKNYRVGAVGPRAIKYRERGSFLTVGEENNRTVNFIRDHVLALEDTNFAVKQWKYWVTLAETVLVKALFKNTKQDRNFRNGTGKDRRRVGSLLELGTGFINRLAAKKIF